MKYISTRGHASSQSFCDILLEGLAPDGGLYLPENYPQISRAELDAWRNLSYPDLAFEILSKFIDDIPAKDLKNIVIKTYTADVYRFTRNNGDATQITPLTQLRDNIFIQELSNGPTLAFKDMAMQLLGNLFEYVLGQRNESINILGATSGDTGSAAEYAMRGKNNVKVFMLSPYGKMSSFQRAQMYSLHDPNIFNIAIHGMFDDAQEIVKAISGDAEFKAQYKIGAVNSINWARVAAQIVYYFQGYFFATKSNDERVAFAVPSGNFGNICAGHIARMMGLPIAKLVLATNENDVLYEFFSNGIYRPRTSVETKVTSSPSMDISKASNLERFIYDLIGRDPIIMNQLWTEINKSGSFNLSNTEYWKKIAQFGIVSGKSTHADRIATIRIIYDEYRVMIDPHTADAVKVALENLQTNQKMIILETAQPTKFKEIILEALGREPECPTELQDIEGLRQQVAIMNPNVDDVKKFIVSNI